MNENKNLPVLGTEAIFEPIKKSRLSINKIEFVEVIPSLDDVQHKWDVSDAQNGSIMAWLDCDILKVSGNGTVLANEDCAYLFSGDVFTEDSAFLNVKSIIFNNLLDVRNMKDASGMFAGCEKLEEVDLSNWNTQNLHDARGMFAYCYKLETIDLSNWNTQNLQEASWMFNGCESWANINLSKWDTKNLENAEGMFHGCNLKEIDLSNWNTEKLKDVNDMFNDCFQLGKVITSCYKIIDEIDDKSIIQAPENCSIADKMRLMSRGISIKPSQVKDVNSKEQTRSKNNHDILR